MTNPPMFPACVRCGDKIDTSEAWRQVIGWERRRKGGGTNAVALREPQNVWMCHPCMTIKKLGREGQGSLL